MPPHTDFKILALLLALERARELAVFAAAWHAEVAPDAGINRAGASRDIAAGLAGAADLIEAAITHVEGLRAWLPGGPAK